MRGASTGWVARTEDATGRLKARFRTFVPLEKQRQTDGETKGGSRALQGTFLPFVLEISVDQDFCGNRGVFPPAAVSSARQDEGRALSRWSQQNWLATVEDLRFVSLYNNMPQVSVVMPVWNGERHLIEAIESLLRQTFSDFELIVVDDGSTDRTLEILKSFHDSRLRILRLEHGGIVHALNQGISKAKADLIARADADDICAPTRLADQILLLKVHPEAVLCYSGVEFFGDAMLVPERQARLAKSRALLVMKMCFLCPIVHSTVLFNKKAFYDAGGYWPEERHAEDYGLWGRLIELGPFVGVDNRLVHFRMHEESISKKSSNEQRKVSERIALNHCRRFMRLNDEVAARAFRVLMTSPQERSLSSWTWFLANCAPRLQWKSLELIAWLSKQTAGVVAGGMSKLVLCNI